MKTKLTAKQRVQRYVARYPQARTTDIAKALNLDLPRVSKFRRNDDDIAAAKKAIDTTPCIRLAIDIASIPAEIKVLDKGRMVGTVIISSSGITFKKANAKKNGQRPLNWNVIERLAQLGIA